jgi:4-hydroxybenzoate polyprenyltransferase
MIAKPIAKPADSLTRHWTDRLPPALKPFAQLSRLDRPIGWQLLLLPCWMGLALVRTQDGFFSEDAIYAGAFLLGAIAMRGAGCTLNDIIDRNIDAQVERTRLRPIPSGAVSVKTAWVWLGLQCILGLIALLLLPRIAQIVALCALPIVAIYPFMKRITWWPQAWLGLAFSWGALVGGAAVAYPDGVPIEAMTLFLGCIAWVIGYDTIYALQDREDDALVGVRSTARLFGEKWRMSVSFFYVAALFIWALAARMAGAEWPTLAAFALIGGFLIWPMLQIIDDAKPASALAAFKYNAWIGLAVLVAFTLEPLSRTLRPLVQSLG